MIILKPLYKQLILISLSLICFIFSFISYSQSNLNTKKTKFLRVTEAYGYIKGQAYLIEQIKSDFPQLEFKIKYAETTFASSFGRSEKNMKVFILEKIGENKFPEFENTLMKEFESLWNKQKFTEDSAEDFLKEIERRSKGEIPEIILETLLSFEYLDSPQKEFASGYVYPFRTKNHPKSSNSDWQIKVPKSWKAEEADRPHIVQKFIDDYGDGINSIMLYVKELPLEKGYKISNKDLADFFVESNMRDMVPNGQKFLSFEKIQIEGKTAGMIEFEGLSERINIKVHIRSIQYVFLFENKMFMVHCSVSSKNLSEDMNLKMKKYLPLFKSVANTIVLFDRYK